jgi:hypothetical protein
LTPEALTQKDVMMKKLLRRALVAVVVTGAVTTATSGAQASELVPCNASPTRVCYTETGDTGIGLDLVQLANDPPIHLADVAAYLDIYKIPVGTGGVQIPCITPVVNGTTADSCDRLGLELISRTPLVSQSVDATLVHLKPTQQRVYVCTATLTVLVANIGLNEVPILSVCQSGLSFSD